MSSPGGLVRCSGCSRHVRVGERSCPFCGALANLARAAMMAGALVACDAPAVNAAYGGPPPLSMLDGPDAGNDAASPVVSSPPVDPSNLPAPAYGGPPPFLQVPPVAPTDAQAPAVLAPPPDAGARKRHPR